MSFSKIVIVYQKIEKEFYGFLSDDLLKSVELQKLLEMAIERVNESCSKQKIPFKKYINKEEMKTFQLFTKDERESLNRITIVLALPGDEKKMKKIYTEFFKVLHLRVKANSYILY